MTPLIDQAVGARVLLDDPTLGGDLKRVRGHLHDARLGVWEKRGLGEGVEPRISARRRDEAGIADEDVVAGDQVNRAERLSGRSERAGYIDLAGYEAIQTRLHRRLVARSRAVGPPAR